MKRRIFTVVLAVVLAVLGTAGVLAYVHQADARALAGQKAVSVLVAQSLIPAGVSVSTALHDGSLSLQKFPASAVPDDALSAITPDLAGLVMDASVQPGQLLLRPMLASAAQVTGSALAIPKGMIAVTIAICLPESVAGYVQAGSQVAVFDTYGAKGAGGQDCDGTHSQSDPTHVHTRIVLPQVQVLAVGSQAANAAATAASSNSGTFLRSNSTNPNQGTVLVTLAVTQANAERLIQLNEGGLPYLALLTSSSQTTFDTSPTPLFQH